MTADHPITPPPELVEQWIQEATGTHFEPYGYSEFIATRAAQWGADQELEACCEWLFKDPATHDLVGREARYLDFELRAARRPKPPNLKEQALAELAEWENVMDIAPDSPIRRALEALPND
jgi:hypothetical protein